MADISQRNKQKQELATVGYSLGFIDDRAPKMTFYRHKPDLNIEGLVVSEVGSSLNNLPSSPDYVLKMSRMDALLGCLEATAPVDGALNEKR